MSQHDGACISGGAQTTLSIHLPPGGTNANFSFPPLPDAASGAFNFALSKATLALAPGCVGTIPGLLANADNGPGTRRNVWIGRVDELPADSALNLGECGCGVAFFLSGSGGTTGDNLRYIRHMASQGFSVVSPDTQAAAAGSGYPRRRDLIPSLSEELAGSDDSYWCANDDYSGGCAEAMSGGTSPACFSSRSESITFDPKGWAAFYERIFTMRQRELGACGRKQRESDITMIAHALSA